MPRVHRQKLPARKKQEVEKVDEKTIEEFAGDEEESDLSVEVEELAQKNKQRAKRYRPRGAE